MMSVHNPCFVELKEHFALQECGHHIFHYYLKDSVGESFLAVVGTVRGVLDTCGMLFPRNS